MNDILEWGELPYSDDDYFILLKHWDRRVNGVRKPLCWGNRQGGREGTNSRTVGRLLFWKLALTRAAAFVVSSAQEAKKEKEKEEKGDDKGNPNGSRQGRSNYQPKFRNPSSYSCSCNTINHIANVSWLIKINSMDILSSSTTNPSWVPSTIC